MRFLLLISVLGVFISIPHSVFAADEFGDRFFNHTPAGLAESSYSEAPDVAMDDLASDLQNIMPAAGDEEENTSSPSDETFLSPASE